jgi:hypothetical protein
MSPLIEHDLSHLTDAELNRQVQESVAQLNPGLQTSSSVNDTQNDSTLNYCSDRTLTRDIVDNAIATAYNDDFGLVLNRTDLTGRRYLVLHEKRTLKPLNRVPIGSTGENRAYAELALLRLMALAEFHGR